VPPVPMLPPSVFTPAPRWVRCASTPTPSTKPHPATPSRSLSHEQRSCHPFGRHR
jgi:hypothetical protein